MFDKIIYISDNTAEVSLKQNELLTINLMNRHIIFEDSDKKILGEIDDLHDNKIKVRLLGEFTANGDLIGGVIRKPKMNANVRIVNEEEISKIVGENRKGNMLLGVSPFYDDYPIYLNVNAFFSNHFAIFGNSGSGKSCGIARIMQNMFNDKNLFPYRSNILLFDSSGEYYNAFKDINLINSNYHYKFLTTNEVDHIGSALRIPIWLLNSEDIAIILGATSHSQLPLIERMLKLVKIFSESNEKATNYQNHLIAKAIMNILYTNQTSPNKRNDIFAILNTCTTKEFSLESPVQGVGYVRKFRDCFRIDSAGQFTENVLVTEYVSSYIHEEYDNYEATSDNFYTLNDLEKSLEFALISEGWLRNENTYADAVTLKVRLHSLITGTYGKYFNYPSYVTLDSYLSGLLIEGSTKYQIVNINLDDVDDSFAKAVTKIFTRLTFEFTKKLKDRASIPFHLIVEEAHRYIQNDTDQYLIGYNIFDRVAKEGRKYGLLLGLISQRPVELSDTVISQCSNFLIFKINHPLDLDYIKKMVPNISEEIVDKQKSLQSGTCLAFGKAFEIPLIVKMQMPSPFPSSGNCNIVSAWAGIKNQDEKALNNSEKKDFELL
ncbi:MAG: ATP-binding protein [Bacilli bacterium]